MRRRQFLERLGPLGGLLAASPAALAFKPDPPRIVGAYPPYLKEGDFVGITCPAGSIAVQNGRYAESAFKRWGLRTKIGSTVGKDWHRFAGTDEERAIDLQRQLDDPVIKAIMFGRGGYGTMRMMDKLNWNGFKKNPKWLIGYSDITALHCHISRNFGIPTIHGKMAMGFNGGESPSELSVKDAIMGTPLMYKWKPHPLNRKGQSGALLVGGNLSLIYAMQASESELETKGKILFIEDVSEYKYTVDRMLMNLKRSGKLKDLAGLIVGGFTQMKFDEDGYFSSSMEEIIFEKVKEYDYPVAFGFPAGHQTPNMALKLNVPYQLNIGSVECILAEPHAVQPFLPETLGHDSIPEPPGFNGTPPDSLLLPI